MLVPIICNFLLNLRLFYCDRCRNVIWLGDLNYRLAPTGNFDPIELLKKNDWQTLLEKDQVKLYMFLSIKVKNWRWRLI